MPVTAISHPICTSCSKRIVERKAPVCLSGRALGLVCDTCREATDGHAEVIFHAFGGMHGTEGRAFDPKTPYHVPVLMSVPQLRDVAMGLAGRNPDLLPFLCEGDRSRLLACAA
jgi:hypothetical protein